MVGSTTVLGLTTFVGSDTVDLVAHVSTGGHQRIEDVLTGIANLSGSITLAFGTITSSRGLRETATWNDVATTFDAVDVNITDSASATASRLLNLRVGGSSVFSVRKSGLLTVVAGGVTVTAGSLRMTAGSVSLHSITQNYGAWANANEEDGFHWGIDGSNGYELVSRVATTDTTRVSVNSSGAMFLNDTSNAKMTIGLTINQGANDDEALALKSSDVAHGMTDQTETDTFLKAGKAAVDGSANLTGYSNTTAYALDLAGIAGSAADTTKATTSIGVVTTTSSVKSGASNADVGADGNLLTVRNRSTTRFILDAEGSSHQDVGTAWTEFDAYDDAALLNALSHEVARPGDPIKEEFRSWLDYNRDALTQARLVTFNPDGHHFVNMSKLTMLLVGAVRQESYRLRALEQRVAALPLPAG